MKHNKVKSIQISARVSGLISLTGKLWIVGKLKKLIEDDGVMVSLQILLFLKRPSAAVQIMMKILQHFPNKKIVMKKFF